MIFKTITDDLGNAKLSLNQTVKDLFNENIFKEQSILSENDANCLKAYNAEIECGITPMTAYYRTLQNASDSAVNMAHAAGNATVNLDQVAKSSTIAELGLKTFSIAGNMLAMWGITKVIQLTATALDNYIHRLDNAKESLSSTQSELSSVNNEIKDTSDKITALEALDPSSLSITDKEDLQRLKDQNEELKIRQKYLEDQEKYDLQKVADLTKEKYGQKYGNVNHEAFCQVLF